MFFSAGFCNFSILVWVENADPYFQDAVNYCHNSKLALLQGSSADHPWCVWTFFYFDFESNVKKSHLSSYVLGTAISFIFLWTNWSSKFQRKVQSWNDLNIMDFSSRGRNVHYTTNAIERNSEIVEIDGHLSSLEIVGKSCIFDDIILSWKMGRAKVERSTEAKEVFQQMFGKCCNEPLLQKGHTGDLKFSRIVWRKQPSILNFHQRYFIYLALYKIIDVTESVSLQ